MRTVWKWQLETTDRQTIAVPRESRALTVQVQLGSPTLWAVVDDALPQEAALVIIAGTGHPLPAEATPQSWIGSYQLDGGRLVFHVFAPALR